MFKIHFPKNKRFLSLITLLLIIVIIFLISGYFLQNQLLDIYDKNNSTIIEDRKGEIIIIQQNEKGYWAEYLEKVPPRFKELLIKKEDQYFFYHPGINPWSTFRAAKGYFNLGPKRASSTISQQLVKILLEQESERNIRNKFIEAFYVLGLETFQTKETILKMYVNSIYFGNQAQGLSEASRLYFNISPELLTDGQIVQLLATISSPSINNPAQLGNKEIALSLTQKLTNKENLILVENQAVKENMRKYSHSDDSYFEVRNFIENPAPKQLTIDKELTKKIREIVKRNIDELKPENANNGSVIIIKLPENELLTLIGSPDPNSFEEGYQINMLKEPRPIGSTIKPFIYLKSFEKGLRPYTLIDDREYKYITAIGFPLYPKNFDYKYRGEVSLHYALSNSLNVPSVKVLEYVGLKEFYNFLEQDLEFKPIQNLENYQLGIALGALEMNLFNLAEYFTIFPNEGILKGVKIYPDKAISEKQIAQLEYIQLINKILNDRKTGIEQFGLKSDLNLFQKNYALKTGTSRNFRDSWVMGYTPDFLVGVWVGNSDNSPMNKISGQIGAGRIWGEIMELLLNSEYNKKTPFEFNLLKEFYNESSIEYGLADDNYEKALNNLKEEDSALILKPHQGDAFLLEKNTKIILTAKKSVKWFINDKFLEEGEKIFFNPKKIGDYQIKAESPNNFQEIITISINE